MRKSFKTTDSKIVSESLNYIVGNSVNNKRIAQILLEEQKSFCAYTDEHISRTDADDIEHFNPTLKGTDKDNYNNWFLVKHQWNNEKGIKWQAFQPVLHPTSHDFEERVIYLDGDYVAASPLDQESINLIALLKLDDPALANNRKKYISRKRSEIMAFGQEPNDFFEVLIKANPVQVSYPRAIKEEFGVDILAMIKSDDGPF